MSDLPVYVRHPVNRQILLCTIGTVFEWYEFTVFVSLTPVISTLFFPGNSRFNAMMATLAVFASGYLMRPLGAVFFGHIGDTRGRKIALLMTLGIMTVATTLIGLIPIGTVFSTLALVICRLMQGFATSGEYPGGLVLLAEQPGQRHRAFIASFGIASTGLGCFLGALAYTLLSGLLTEQAMLAWGWRILFLLAGPIGMLGYLVRTAFLESPEFERWRETKTNGIHRLPIIPLIKEHSRNLLALLCVTSLTNALVYINLVYLGNHAVETGQLTLSSVRYLFLVVTASYVTAIFVSGYLSDTLNRRKMILAGCVLIMMTAMPVFRMAADGGAASQFFAGSWLSLVLGMIVGPYASLLPESFPLAVRYSGISLVLNLAGAIFGATAPLISAWLTELTGSPVAPAYYLVSLAMLALGGVLCLGYPAKESPSAVSMYSVDESSQG